MKTTKFNLRSASLVLVLVFLLQSLALPVFSEEALEEVFEEDGISNFESVTSVVSNPEMEKIMALAVASRAETANIEQFDIPYSTAGRDYLRACFRNVRCDNPEFFYLSNTYSFYYRGNMITAIKFQYTLSEMEIVETAEKIELEFENIMRYIRDDMSQVEKMLAVHDYFCTHYEYDEVRLANGTIPNSSYMLSGVMAYRIGVCQSYAFAYQYVLNRLGIECTTVSSDAMNHMWNLVKVDGIWYHVDVTWDDPTSDKCGNARHLFFLVSDESMRDSDHRHYGWSTNVECNDSSYEGKDWYNSSSSVVFDNENMYVAFTDGNIKAINRKTGAVKTIYTCSDRWYLPDGRYYTSKYEKLVLINNRIYFNGPKAIYSMSTSGSDLRIEYSVSGSTNIYGIYNEGNVIRFATATEIGTYLPYNGSIQVAPDPVKQVKINQPTFTLGVGQKLSITAEVNAGALADGLIWTVSDTKIAEIVNGRVIPKAKGKVKLRATSPDNSKVYSEVELNITMIFGDGNGDGVMDSADAVKIAQYLASWSSAKLDTEAKKACDLNLDGRVDSLDAVLLAQYLAHWDVSLGVPST